MPAEAHPEVSWRPRHSPWLVGLTVTLATFMEVLDTSIANVALPHIAGGLSASLDESTWVLTSYLVSNAVVLPISAWISSRVGRKRFYMSCVVLFTMSSFLCGFAPNLQSLIFFRVLQGIGGGGLAPSEQGILADTFEPQQRGMGFAMYGLAVVFAARRGSDTRAFLTRAQFRSVATVFFPAVTMVVLTHFIGLYVSGAFYLAAYMRWIGRHTWMSILLVAVGVPVAAFLIFEVWFLVPLPKGPLETRFGY